MANTKQSKKRILVTAKKTAINKARMNRIRTFVRKVEDAVKLGNKEAAVTALREAQPEIMRGATKGVLHKNTASRKVSRLAQSVKKLCLAAA
jgi:small subunit ribosomal protein S20